MISPLNLLLSEYPNLSKLIEGQDVVIKMKAVVSKRILGEHGESISIIPTFIEVDNTRKMSPQEIMLASIDRSLNRQAVPIP